MANIDLVTSHKGTPHITTQNAVDLIAGLSGHIDGIKYFVNLYDNFEMVILNNLEISIKTGAALAGGLFWILEESYDWLLDDGVAGYSRVDMLFLVVRENSVNMTQTADFVYVAGDDYPNGSTERLPETPTAADIIYSFPFVRVNLSDGAIVDVINMGSPYISNATVSNSMAQVTGDLGGLRFGIDGNGRYGYKKVGADTVIPFRNPTGNATAADVLVGKTFSNAASDDVVGTMADRQNYNVNIGVYMTHQEVNLPDGFYKNASCVVDAENICNEYMNAGKSAKKPVSISIAMNRNGQYELWVGNTVVDVFNDSEWKTLYASYNKGLTIN